MGNHEYCTKCEQSDFHLGQPCLPEHLAAAEARRAEIEARAKFRKARLSASSLSCPFCPAQAFPENIHGVIPEYFVSSEGDVVKYLCCFKHEFFVFIGDLC